MGCCISYEKETVYEVTLDSDGVAQRVPKGQGTHFIHISENNETHLEEKINQSVKPTTIYTSKRVHPSTIDEIKEEKTST